MLKGIKKQNLHSQMLDDGQRENEEWSTDFRRCFSKKLQVLLPAFSHNI